MADAATAAWVERAVSIGSRVIDVEGHTVHLALATNRDFLPATTNARPLAMKGQAIRGWLHVAATTCAPSADWLNGSPLGQPPPETRPSGDQIDDGHPQPRPGP